MLKLSVAYRRNNFYIKAKEISGLGKYIGLMFKRSNTENLFFKFSEYEKPVIHSFFVFFPFLALWLDEKNKILKWSIVRPFKFYVSPKFKPAKLIELPLNKRNKKIVGYIVGN